MHNKEYYYKTLTIEDEIKPLFKGTKVMVYENILNHNLYIKYYDKFYNTQVLKEKVKD